MNTQTHTKRHASVYVRRDKAYVPTLARTDVGVYLTVDPVYTVSLSVDELAQAIERVLSAGNPRIPHPTLDKIDHLPQPVLKAAKVGSWTKLAQGGTSYSILMHPEGATLYFSKLDEKGRFVTDISKTRQFPPATDVRDIVQAILDDVHSRPELQNPG
jgi:hypothetical protein